MSALSMKGKEKGRKILCLFRVYFYIVETLHIESLFCYILSICAWRHWCMQMPLEKKRETQRTEGNQEFFLKWMGGYKEIKASKWQTETEISKVRNFQIHIYLVNKRKKTQACFKIYKKFIPTVTWSVKFISFFLMKAAGKEQDIIVVDRNADKVVAYKVARKD